MVRCFSSGRNRRVAWQVEHLQIWHGMIYFEDRVGLAIAEIRKAMLKNIPRDAGSVFLGEAAQRFETELPRMQAAGLFFGGELETLQLFFKTFDHLSDYLREHGKHLLRQIWPSFAPTPPNWKMIAKKRKRLYQTHVVVVW
jgi:hypothetical protein